MSLVENIEEFTECAIAIPVCVDVHELNDGSGLQETLVKQGIMA